MSGLRRSRPDEQDESLRRLRDIKISHTSQQTDAEKPTRPSSYSFESNSFAKELICTTMPFSLYNKNNPLRNSSCELAPSLTKRNETDNLISAQLIDRPVITFEKGNLIAAHSIERTVLRHSALKKTLCSDSNDDDILQINDYQRKISDSSTKWEKLHSLLVAMKDEPFDVDKYLEPSFLKSTESADAKSNSLENVHSLLSENAQLKESLKTMESDLLHMMSERDSALSYIYQLKSKASLTNTETSDDLGTNLYHEQGIEGLCSPDITKEQVLEIMVPLVKEFKHQKSYLDRLMMVVVMRAPWMLDEVDDAEMLLRSDTEEDDNNSDGEVWC
ncbi:hypothetical protein Btru_074536 [Bulinus truncatus]|nr:hypothetical protein Btru_074536 [Bulinus truncatus]